MKVKVTINIQIRTISTVAHYGQGNKLDALAELLTCSSSYVQDNWCREINGIKEIWQSRDMRKMCEDETLNPRVLKITVLTHHKTYWYLRCAANVIHVTMNQGTFAVRSLCTRIEGRWVVFVYPGLRFQSDENELANQRFFDMSWRLPFCCAPFAIWSAWESLAAFEAINQRKWAQNKNQFYNAFISTSVPRLRNFCQFHLHTRIEWSKNAEKSRTRPK